MTAIILSNKHHLLLLVRFFFLWRCDPTRVMASSFLRFIDLTQRRTTVGRTPLDEWSARRRDLYLTTHNTHNRQTSMPPVGSEPTISAGERPQTYALGYGYLEPEPTQHNSLDRLQIKKYKSKTLLFMSTATLKCQTVVGDNIPVVLVSV